MHSVDRFGDSDLRATAQQTVVLESWLELAECLTGLKRLPNEAPLLLAGGIESQTNNSAQHANSSTQEAKSIANDANRQTLCPIDTSTPSNATESEPDPQKAAYATSGPVESESEKNLPRSNTHLLDDLHRKFPVYGPSAAQMRTLRDPSFWKSASLQAGIRFPGISDTYPHDEANNDDHKWLRKSRHASGGLGVSRVAKNEVPPQQESHHAETSHIFSPADNDFSPAANDHQPGIYYQQEISGRSIGVTCILTSVGSSHSANPPAHSANPSSQVTVLGATESWKSEQWQGPSEFIYRGSWGPIELSHNARDAIQRLAQFVHRETQLRGWLQMDFIESDDGELWLLEMNPRWTAGMEVLTRVGCNPVPYHIAAYEPSATPPASDSHLAPQLRFAKGIVYAAQDIALNAARAGRLRQLPRDRFADIPFIDRLSPSTEVIPKGTPVLTVHDLIQVSVPHACSPSNPNRRNDDEARRTLLDRIRVHASELTGWLYD